MARHLAYLQEVGSTAISVLLTRWWWCSPSSDESDASKPGTTDLRLTTPRTAEWALRQAGCATWAVVTADGPLGLAALQADVASDCGPAGV